MLSRRPPFSQPELRDRGSLRAPEIMNAALAPIDNSVTFQSDRRVASVMCRANPWNVPPTNAAMAPAAKPSSHNNDARFEAALFQRPAAKAAPAAPRM